MTSARVRELPNARCLKITPISMCAQSTLFSRRFCARLPTRSICRATTEWNSTTNMLWSLAWTTWKRDCTTNQAKKTRASAIGCGCLCRIPWRTAVRGTCSINPRARKRSTIRCIILQRCWQMRWWKKTASSCLTFSPTRKTSRRSTWRWTAASPIWFQK